MSTPDLDIRTLREPEKTPAVFRTYDALERGESFVLVDDHNPPRCSRRSAVGEYEG